MVIKEIKAMKLSRSANAISEMQEVDKEKQRLLGDLFIAKLKLKRSAKDSMMRKFWEKEIKRIEKKLGK